MNYNKLNTLLAHRQQKKIANNTWAVRDTIGDAIYIRLHNTPILSFYPDGRVRYNTGGWRTVTTKSRMNEYGPARIHQHNFEWFITFDGQTEEYFDGITITAPTVRNFTEAIQV